VGVKHTISAGERPAAAHLLRSWVRLPPGAWIFVCCKCHVLSGRSLCDELIARPEEPYELWCVVVCDLEISRICTPYTYDIRSLRVNDLSLILLTWRKWWANNASNYQIGFNLGFKGLITQLQSFVLYIIGFLNLAIQCWNIRTYFAMHHKRSDEII
jgi:hypothetical protein